MSLKNSLLIIGGHPTGAGRQVREYSPLSGGWLPEERWDQLTVARHSHACAATAHVVLIVGGHNGANLDSTEILQISTRKIRAGGRLLQARRHLAMAVLGNNILVLGGLGNGGGLNSLEKWNEASETWSKDRRTLKGKKNGMGAVSISTDKICPV